MSKLCSTLPVLRSVITSVPHGAVFGVTVKPKSNMFTSMFVVCGLAHVEVPPGVVVVVAGGVVVVDVGTGGGGVTATPRTPFIPSFAWPGTVQRYSYLPFLSVTVSVCERPGLSEVVTLPLHAFVFVVPVALEQISNVCGTLPLFV